MKKDDKDFTRRFDFNDIKFPVKLRDIHKLEEKNYIKTSVLDYKNVEKLSIYVSKKTFKVDVDLRKA